MDTSSRQKIIDDEHLKLLSYGYLIEGCLTVVFSCFFIVYLIFLSTVAKGFDQFNQELDPQNIPPSQIFDIFFYVLGAIIVLGVLYGIAKIISYRFIKQRKHRMFTYIVGIPGMIFFPYGTALGVATIIVLSRSSVIEQYKKISHPLREEMRYK